MEETFSVKSFLEEMDAAENRIVFTVKGVYDGEPFVRIVQKRYMDFSDKESILAEVRDRLRHDYGMECHGLSREQEKELDGANEHLAMIRETINVLQINPSIGTVRMVFDCAHKFASGKHIDCPLCGEVVR